MAEKWNVCIARSALVHCCTIFIWDLGWSIQMYTSMLRSSSWEITSSAWSKKMSEMLFNSDKLAGKDHFAPLLLQGLWRWPQDYILHLILSPDDGEACMDAMADLAAANAPNLELIAVSTDSLCIGTSSLCTGGTNLCRALSWLAVEKVEGQERPMIMLADKTGWLTHVVGM